MVDGKIEVEFVIKGMEKLQKSTNNLVRGLSGKTGGLGKLADKLSKKFGSAEGGAGGLGLKSVVSPLLALVGGLGILISSSKFLQKTLGAIMKLIGLLLKPIGDMISIFLLPIIYMLKPIVRFFNILMRPFIKKAMEQIRAGDSEAASGTVLGGLGLALVEALKGLTIVAAPAIATAAFDFGKALGIESFNFGVAIGEWLNKQSFDFGFWLSQSAFDFGVSVGEWIREQAFDFGFTIGQLLREKIQGIKNFGVFIGEFLGEKLTGIKDFGVFIGEFLEEKLTGVFDFGKFVGESIGKMVKTNFQTIWDALIEKLKDLLDSVTGTFSLQKFWDAIMNHFIDLITGVDFGLALGPEGLTFGGKGFGKTEEDGQSVDFLTGIGQSAMGLVADVESVQKQINHAGPAVMDVVLNYIV